MTCPGDEGRMLLQQVPTNRPPPVRPLYWRASPAQAGAHANAELLENGAIRFGPGATLSFDTYFGSLFEQHWRLNTRFDDIVLRVQANGPLVLRVWRASLHGNTLLHEAASRGEATVEAVIRPEVGNKLQYGLLCFSLTALDGAATLQRADWLASVQDVSPVGMAAVFCTFNREADIARVLTTLADDDRALDNLSRIYVVNQGRPGLARHPALARVAPRYNGRLRVIEQPNFGGAGGFTRGLLEALDDPSVTHAVLLDDDIRIEPESLPRMAAFFALAVRDQPVGGHMLDLLQPLRLFEAGATISSKNWSFHPQHHMLDLSRDGALAEIAGRQSIHYNGWWLFGVPLRLLRDRGLPLPCFIRGDDMEFGLRLHQDGIYTVPLPGVAVWHEPFYVKLGGWQLYYETRNMLVAAALHLDFTPRAVAVRMLKHLLLHLLTFRYYSTALIVRGIEDFLVGPALLDREPRTLHAELHGIRARYDEPTVSAGAVLDPAPVRRLPKTRAGYALALATAIARHWFAKTRNVPARRMHVRDFAWITLAGADHIALDTGWDVDLPTFHRSRETFRALSWHGARAVLALYRSAPAHARQWQAAAPRLTSDAFWRGYLGVAAPSSSNGKPREATSREDLLATAP